MLAGRAGEIVSRRGTPSNAGELEALHTFVSKAQWYRTLKKLDCSLI